MGVGRLTTGAARHSTLHQQTSKLHCERIPCKMPALWKLFQQGQQISIDSLRIIWIIQRHSVLI